MRTWYDVLGVAPHASPDEVRTAYRIHARALHPDSRDPDLPAAEADAALRLLNAAWEVLGEPGRRAAYDEKLEGPGLDADGEPWLHDGWHRQPRFPWWIVVLAVLVVIFVFTAYAGGPAPAPTPK